MTQKDSKAQKLTLLLKQQQAALQRMLEILLQEYQALKENDLKAFDKAVEEKQLQARTLEDMEKQFQPLIEMTGSTIDKKLLENLINDSYTEDKNKQLQLQSDWEEFLKVLNNCDKQNRVNNRIIESSRINIRQALDILRGETSNPVLYSASGKKNPDDHGNSIAIA